MTVSITVERYWAVCRPTVKLRNPRNSKNISPCSQEYRSAGLVQNKSTRVAKYLVPVIIGSVLLNVPKFFEVSSVIYDPENGTVNIDSAIGYCPFLLSQVEYNISSHRRDPTFIW